MSRRKPWDVFILFVFIIITAKGILLAPIDTSSLLQTTSTGHEWQYNLFRINALADAYHQNLSGRWIDSFSYGFGYPLFHFTASLPFSLGAVLVLAGFDTHAALNWSWFIIIALTGFSMFWALKPISGRWGALLGSACYLLAPYHLVDIYVRTALAETAAFIVPPLLLNALWIAPTSHIKSLIVGSLALCALLLSHLLSGFIIGLGFGIFLFALLLLQPEHATIRLKMSLIFCSIGLGLSAFFWLPALLDLDTVRGFNAISSGYYNFQQHFVYPHQLIQSHWLYGASEAGPNDNMSFSLGIGILTFAVASLVITVFQWYKTRTISAQQSFVIASAISAVFMVFLCLESSISLWRHLPGIKAVQFPWRFLLSASFFLAVISSALPNVLKIIFITNG